jgi:hypothetical protein
MGKSSPFGQSLFVNERPISSLSMFPGGPDNQALSMAKRAADQAFQGGDIQSALAALTSMAGQQAGAGGAFMQSLQQGAAPMAQQNLQQQFLAGLANKFGPGFAFGGA